MATLRDQLIPLDRTFSSIEALWDALLRLSKPTEFCPFAEHEETWIAAFGQYFPTNSEGVLWEVLQISRSIDSFMVNLGIDVCRRSIITSLRSLLLNTRPHDSVYVCVFDPVVAGKSDHIGALAVFRDEIWGTWSLAEKGIASCKAQR